jgi:hypothetical protein
LKPLSLFALGVAILAAGCSKDPCDGVAGTCVSLHVVGRGISAVDQLAIDLSGAVSAPAKKTPPDGPRRLSLPIDVGVSIANAPTGDVKVHVVALSGNNDDAAEGSADAQVSPGAHVKATVTLVAGAITDLSVTGDLETTDGAADASADAAVDAASNPDLAKKGFVQLVQGRFGANGRFLSSDDQLISVVDIDPPQNHHVFDRNGNELAIPPAPYQLPVYSGGVVIFGVGVDGSIFDELWAWHDGKAQKLSPSVNGTVNAPDGQRVAFLSPGGTSTPDLYLADRVAPGADFSVRKLASSIDKTNGFPAMTFSSNGYFYYADLTSNNIMRVAPGDTSTPGTNICSGCTPFIPSDDGSQLVSVSNVGADAIGQLALAPIGLGNAMLVGARDVATLTSPVDRPFTLSYESNTALAAPVFGLGSTNIAYLESIVDGGWATGVNYLVNNGSMTIKSPVDPPSPPPITIYFATDQGAALATNGFPLDLWWVPWSSPMTKVEDVIQSINDVRPTNSAFIYTAGSGPSSTWTLKVFKGSPQGALPSAAAGFGARWVDDRYALFVDTNADLREIDTVSFTSQTVPPASSVHAFDYHANSRTLVFIRRSPSADPTDGIWIGTLP